ncbi:MAG: ECF transporter S component [archaeon]|nr:ECF transporter S component [archaeon]
MSERNKKKNEEIQDKFIDTGQNSSQKYNSKYYFSTQDLLIMAILGVMGGFISGTIPFSLLIKTWYPLVGGTQMVSAHHILWMTISYGLTKKKPSIIITGIINGFMATLLGSTWGIFEIVIYLYEGSSLLIGFILIERLGEKNTNLGWGIAGGIGNITQVPFFWILSGKIYIIHFTLFIMACMFAFASGVFIAGLLGKLIVDRLEKAGIS